MNKLLIIEDDVTIRNALRILLENQGYFIEEAHDGEEGLQKFDSTFDLLIIDIMMPNISGIDVCRKIVEKSYVPILFLTAKSLETDKMEALSAGGRLSCKTILLRGADSAYSRLLSEDVASTTMQMHQTPPLHPLLNDVA